MTNTDGSAAGSSDDRDKLLPESERSADEQVIWLALGLVLLAGLLFFGVSRCGNVGDQVTDAFTLGSDRADDSITAVIGGDRDLDTSADFFDRSDFDQDFDDSSGGPFTVLAPSDDAWDDIDIGDFTDEQVAEGAGLHVIDGEYTLGALERAGTIETIGGATLTFGDDLINGEVGIEDADIEAANGIVHRIDGVLTGQQAVAPDPTEAPEPDPTPAPTAEATAVPEPTPAPEPTPTAEPEPEPEPEAAFTIASLATESPDLSQVTGLIVAAGLADTLADPAAGPFTVFAPTNDAFVDNPLIDGLSESDADSIVRYHVVQGLVPAADVVAGARFETLGGETLIIGSEGLLPGGIDVISPDQQVDNGIVHVIGGLLVPPPITLRNLNAAIALEPIQFDVGSAAIRPESEATLQRAIDVLTRLPEGTQVEVGGHTDTDGGADANQQLSEARAASVVAYLVNAGVDPDTLTSVGYGETDLAANPELTDEDKQTNRRIEFTRPEA